MNETATPTPYARIGGEPALRRLVRLFYEYMDTLPEAYGIRKLHQGDLSSAEEKLFMFMSGWLGGPIASDEAEQWMLCMRLALAEVVTDEALRASLDKSLTELAYHIRNRNFPTRS